MKKVAYTIIFAASVMFFGCSKPANEKIAVIIDTDANNELDDQHALAYLFFNGNTFSVPGVTVNATWGGGNVDQQYKEAERVMKLCTVFGKIPLLKGANGKFEEILPTIGNDKFDGSDAVNFIIQEANKPRKHKLVLLPIGKLTNIALALAKDPGIKDKVRIVWLGSNYPDRGEYNKENDVPSMNYVLSVDVPFEMVTVRYGKETGTAHVFATKEEVLAKMPGLGPKSELVEGRHGGSFSCFGDYSVNLFSHCDFYGTPPHRALFDMAAVAVVKNPAFAQKRTIPCPKLMENGWVEQPENPRKISVWENFDRDAIMADFYQSMENVQLAKTN
jgi:inosine-uridine nucleoside N-ribohydrolase